MAFDPDAYLAQTDTAVMDAPAFDPDAYLAQKPEPPDRTEPTDVSGFDPDAYLAQKPVASSNLPDIGRDQGDENLFQRGLRDTGVAVAKTVVGTGEALMGLTDLAVSPVHVLSGGKVPLPSQGFREMGYNPELTQRFLDTLYSRGTQEARQKVGEADGFVEKVKTAVKNPSTIVASVGESAGPMLLGGGAARQMVTKAAMNPALAAALGEALITAGGNVSQITQANEDRGISGKQALVATGGAALTGLISLGSGRLQKAFGIDDVDVLIAGGRSAAAKSLRNPAVKLALSSFFEGAVEELPQSIQEQIANNVALEKPWDEGLDEAAAMGLLSGVAMGLGGGAGGMVLGRNQEAGSHQQPSPVPVPEEIKAWLDQQAGRPTPEIMDQGSEVGGQPAPAATQQQATDDQPIYQVGADGTPIKINPGDPRYEEARRNIEQNNRPAPVIPRDTTDDQPIYQVGADGTPIKINPGDPRYEEALQKQQEDQRRNQQQQKPVEKLAEKPVLQRGTAVNPFITRKQVGGVIEPGVQHLDHATPIMSTDEVEVGSKVSILMPDGTYHTAAVVKKSKGGIRVKLDAAVGTGTVKVETTAGIRDAEIGGKYTIGSGDDGALVFVFNEDTGQFTSAGSVGENGLNATLGRIIANGEQSGIVNPQSTINNIYMRMPIERVQADASLGNKKALDALAVRMTEAGRPTTEEARPPTAPTGEAGQPQIADVINREVNNEQTIPNERATERTGKDQAGNGALPDEGPVTQGTPAARYSTGQEVTFQRKRYVNRDGKWFNTKGGNAVRRADLIKQINESGKRILTTDEKAINATRLEDRRRRNQIADEVLAGDSLYQRFIGEVSSSLLIAPPKMAKRGSLTGKFKGYPEEYKAIPQRFRSPRGMQLDVAAAGVGMDDESFRAWLINLNERIEKAQDRGATASQIVDSQLEADLWAEFEEITAQGVLPDRAIREEFPEVWKEFVKLNGISEGALRADPAATTDDDMGAFMALTEDLEGRAALEDEAAAAEAGRQEPEVRGQESAISGQAVAPAGEMFADVPFNLMGAAPVEQAPLKPKTQETPALFSNRELMGRNYDDLDNKGIQDLQVQAIRENVDLTNVPNSAPRIREAIRAARRSDAPRNPVAGEIQAGADELFGSGAVREESQLDFFGQQELNFSYAKRPDKLTTEQATNQNAAESSARHSLWRIRGSLLGNAITREFKANGSARLIGKQANTPQDLAAVAQIYRNPSFETFRYVYTKGGEIVHESGITSRLPGSAAIFVRGENFEQTMNEVRATQARIGADGVWVLHNHPSGTMSPSGIDGGKGDMPVSRRIQAELGPSYKGHVIINHKRFVFIDPFMRWDVYDIPNGGAGLPNQYDPNNISVSHPLIGEQISNPDALAHYASQLQQDENSFELIGVGNGIKGIMTIPVSSISGKSDVRLLALLRQFMRATGVNQVFAVNVPLSVDSGVFKRAMQASALRDVIFKDRNDSISASETRGWYYGGDTYQVGRKETVGYRVNEGGTDSYNSEAESRLRQVQSLYEQAQGETDPAKLEAIRQEFYKIRDLADAVNGRTAPAVSANTPVKRKQLADMSREELQSEAKAQGLSPAGTVDVIRKRLLNAQDGERVRARSFLQTVQSETGLPKELLDRLASVDPQTYQQMRSGEMVKAFRAWLDQGAANVSRADAFVMSNEKADGVKGTLAAALIDRYNSEDNWEAASRIIDHIDQLARENGQFNQALSFVAAHSGKSFMRSVDKFLQKYKVSIPDDVLESIRQDYIKATRIDDEAARMDAVSAVIERVAALAPTKWNDWIGAYRYTNMLSNPRSHERNVWGNFFQTFVARPLALAGQGRLIGAVQYEASAFKSLPNAVQAFKDAWNSGSTGNRWFESMNSNMSKFESERMRQGAQAVPARKALLVVGRLLEAQDKFFSAMIAQGETYRLVQKGVTPDQAVALGNKLADDLLYREKLGNDMGDKSKAFGVRALDAVGYQMEQLRKAPFIGKPAGWFLPFIRTPINVGKRMVEFSPLGFVRNPTAGKMTAEQAGRAVAGSAVMMAGAMLALAGQTTGAPPKDKDERKLWYASGRRPWSVLLGGKWIPMWYFGSFAGALALPAAARDTWADDPATAGAPVHKKMVSIIANMSAFYGSQTPLQGVGTFLDIAMGKSEYTTAGSLAFNVGQFVPASGFLRWANQLVLDPVYRRGGSFEEGFKKDYPFLSTSTRAVMGPEIKSPSGRVLQPAEPVVRKTGSTLLPYDVDTVNPEMDARWQDRNEILKNRGRNNEALEQDIRRALRGDMHPDQVIDTIKRMSGGSVALREERARLMQKAKARFKDAGLEK